MNINKLHVIRDFGEEGNKFIDNKFTVGVMLDVLERIYSKASGDSV